MYLYVLYKAKKDYVNDNRCGEYGVRDLFFLRNPNNEVVGVYEKRKDAIKDIMLYNRMISDLKIRNHIEDDFELVVSSTQLDTSMGLLRNNQIIYLGNVSSTEKYPADAKKVRFAKIKVNYYVVNEKSIFEKDETAPQKGEV